MLNSPVGSWREGDKVKKEEEEVWIAISILYVPKFRGFEEDFGHKFWQDGDHIALGGREERWQYVWVC